MKDLGVSLKKVGSCLLCALLISSTCCFTLLKTEAASTADFTIVDGVLTEYNGPGGYVTVPNTVTKISIGAFYANEDITSVIIPQSVTSIDAEAFCYCYELKKVTISYNVASIGDKAFSECYSLTQINVDSGNKNYSSQNGVLFNKAKTTLLACPGAKTDVYDIPNSVIIIGKNAFDDCNDLSGINIPNSVTNISAEAFLSCSFENILIPSSVSYIGVGVFEDCSSLSEINVSDSNKNYASQNGALFNKTKTALIKCPEGKSGTLIIPSSVKYISNRAVYSCGGLSKVVLPGSVISIGDSAFEYCNGLKSITIPNAVTSIGEYAFDFCYQLTNVTIPSNVKNIGIGAFELCDALTQINVDSNNATFSSKNGVLFNKTKTKLIQCPGGKTGSYTIPSGVKSIEEKAFSGCSNLKSVIVSSGVTSIGDYAFDYCDSLTNITIPSSVVSIGSDALPTPWIDNYRGDFVTAGNKILVKYKGTSTNVVIPQNITGIGGWAFEESKGITSVTIPGTVTSIGEYAFYFCRKLTKVTIPSSVTKISVNAFSGTSWLKNYPGDFVIVGNGILIAYKGKATNLTIPGVKSIVELAFRDCSTLKSVMIPATVVSIQADAFDNCPKLTQINVCSSNANYASQNGVLFNKTKTKLIQYPGGRMGYYIVPTSVTSIDESAFSDCAGLTGVIISNSVKSIGDFAFASCSSLQIVSMSGSLNSIGSDAFYERGSEIKISCPAGSNAEMYAINHGIPYGFDRNFVVFLKQNIINLKNLLTNLFLLI